LFVFTGNTCDFERACKLRLSGSATGTEGVETLEGWASDLTGLAMTLFLDLTLEPLEFVISGVEPSVSFVLVSRSESIEADLSDKLEMTVDAE